MYQSAHQQWGYFVLNVNIEQPSSPPSPEEASKKLKGTLSPSFIQEQFPQEYKNVKSGAPMEQQLQTFLDELGAKGWELINISTVGSKLLFFSKGRKSTIPIRKLPDHDVSGKWKRYLPKR